MIKKFRNEYAFLSNFSPSRITLDGASYPTIEHAYQAAKTLDPRERAGIAGLASPVMAKRAGRRVKLRPDWEQVKIELMEDLVRRTFDDPDLAAKLLATGEEELVEGNTWGDRFWGVCRGVRRNELGKILMRVRSELARQEAARRDDAPTRSCLAHRASHLPLARLD